MTIGAANSGFPPVDRVVRPRVDDDTDLSGETSSDAAADERQANPATGPKTESSGPQTGPYSPPPAPGSLLNIKI